MGLHPAPHTSLLTSLSSYHRPAVAYCSMSSDKGSSRVPATCPADHEPVIPTENNPNHRLPDQLLYIYISTVREVGVEEYSFPYWYWWITLCIVMIVIKELDDHQRLINRSGVGNYWQVNKFVPDWPRTNARAYQTQKMIFIYWRPIIMWRWSGRGCRLGWGSAHALWRPFWWMNDLRPMADELLRLVSCEYVSSLIVGQGVPYQNPLCPNNIPTRPSLLPSQVATPCISRPELFMSFQ